MIKTDFKSYDETLKNLLQSISPYEKCEKVTITNALGRILASDIKAKYNYPAHPTAAMDGYACKASDLNKGATLKLLGEVPAGSLKDITIKSGECIKTFTGSLMANGSNTLIPIENVSVDRDLVRINEPVKEGYSVRKVGESYKKDEILLKKGTKISYSEIALLAELGEFFISVFIRPKVGVLATGSEIKDLGEVLENEAQIRSSNHVAIAAMAKLMGCEVVIFPIVKDEKDLLTKAVLNALKSCDILITTGGVSMGDYDFIKSTLGLGEFEMIVDGAAIKPGRHIKIAKFKDRYIFALPGFPYSAMVTCVLYVREFLKVLLKSDENFRLRAVLDEDYARKTPFLEFVACNIFCDENGVLHANLKGKKQGSSAIVNNLNQNAALLVVPKSVDGYKKGEVVEILKMV